jgi:hypothetical protein
MTIAKTPFASKQKNGTDQAIMPDRCRRTTILS